MKCRLFVIEVFTVLLSFYIQNTLSYNELYNIKRLLNYNSKGPIIAVLLKDNVKTVDISDTDGDDVITPDVNAVEPPHDQKLYNLYRILRTTQENENIDPEATKVFEKTQSILRQALRARCKRLDKCYKKCPPKKKYTCTITCKETYDDYDICKKPKPCKKPKCGKTMPPSWILKK